MKDSRDCRYCGLWLIGKCPIFSNKRKSPLSTEEKAFIERLKDFMVSEWIEAAIAEDSHDEADQFVDEEGNIHIEFQNAKDMTGHLRSDLNNPVYNIINRLSD